jgi:cobalt/nickel transport system permease protein
MLGALQEKTAFLPDYSFKKSEEKEGHAKSGEGEPAAEPGKVEKEEWPNVSAGTSVSGLIGGALVLVLAAFIGFALKKRSGTR